MINFSHFNLIVERDGFAEPTCRAIKIISSLEFNFGHYHRFMMVALAWAGRLSKTILKLLSSFGGLDGTLRPLDLDFALLPLDGSHINLGFTSTVINIRTRMAPDHRASIPV